MIIESIEGGYDKNFTYLIACEKSRQAAVIDAAVGAEQILRTASDLNLNLQYLILTHSHHDHYAWADALLKKMRNMTLVMFGNAIKDIGEDKHISVEDKDTMFLGGEQLKFLHTPGHYPDSICVVADGAVFTGDTLFVGRTGRTTSPKSDTRQLYKSIKEKILPLPDETVVYPGHNYGDKPYSTIREERENNKFLQADSADEFKDIMAEYEEMRKVGT
ncbi:MAG: MBL fold metallo-hydrolase [Candidatus Marinimicrobia bacterium]|nr:MBL fold metallo-hydrolase [Candidatus Neomarinimicrobiota bacterium]MCF7828010.1 MBL fold metallo-hydrolase [Candidatus Neomarinimicrobiota bacterium]MCF7879235.1 MBL fold metallo-hydrolase [Candidatus Neomarinimicrobiota bacterium]